MSEKDVRLYFEATKLAQRLDHDFYHTGLERLSRLRAKAWARVMRRFRRVWGAK